VTTLRTRSAVGRDGPLDTRETMPRLIRTPLRAPLRATPRRAAFGLVLSLGLALGLGLSACAVDDATLEAKLEKAQMSIDQGNYAAAEALLLEICPVLAECPDHILALLAEAQMGAGGVDVLNLLAAMDGLSTGDDTAVFDILDAMFGADGVTGAKVADLVNAIATLQTIAAPTANDTLQLAAAAAAHMVASVMLQTDPGNTGTFDSGLVDAPLAAAVTNDLLLVTSSAALVDAYLGGTTDATTDLGGLIEDIEGPGGDGVVDASELTTFVGSL